MTKRFCTLSDSSFIVQGLALLSSLRKSNSDFTMYYLCLDQQTHEIMKNEPNVKAVSLEEFEEDDPQIKEAKTLPPSQEALNVAVTTGRDAKWIQHCWRLASCWTSHVLDATNSEDIVYVDSDLFFFGPWQNIYNAAGTKSIGIVKNNSNNDKINGRFNVSCIYFKNDLVGNQALFSWRNWMLNPQNEYSEEYGDCGDQKYLELFPQLFREENISVLDDKGLIQRAPWNLSAEEENITFFHFSNFQADYDDPNFFIPAGRHGLFEKKSLASFPRMMYTL